MKTPIVKWSPAAVLAIAVATGGVGACGGETKTVYETIEIPADAVARSTPSACAMPGSAASRGLR